MTRKKLTPEEIKNMVLQLIGGIVLIAIGMVFFKEAAIILLKWMGRFGI